MYAQALAQIGQEQASYGAIYDDLQAVLKLYDEDRWFRGFYTSPRIDRDVKWPAVRAAFEGQVCRPVLGLLKVLIMKSREALYDNVVDQFERFKDMAENRTHAYLAVAKPLSPELRQALVGRLETASGKTVELHERVDPSLLGGAALRVGDKVIDRTLKTRLTALRKHLIETTRPGRAASGS